MNQVIGHPRALLITAGFLGIMAFTGLPFVPMIVLSGGCLVLAGVVSREQTAVKQRAVRQRQGQETGKPRQPEKAESLLRVDPMELEVGYGLIRLADPEQGGDLLDRVARIRRDVAWELGIVVPPIRIRDNMELGPNEYRIRVRGNRVAGGTVVAELCAMGPNNDNGNGSPINRSWRRE